MQQTHRITKKKGKTSDDFNRIPCLFAWQFILFSLSFAFSVSLFFSSSFIVFRPKEFVSTTTRVFVHMHLKQRKKKRKKNKCLYKLFINPNQFNIGLTMRIVEGFRCHRKCIFQLINRTYIFNSYMQWIWTIPNRTRNGSPQFQFNLNSVLLFHDDCHRHEQNILYNWCVRYITSQPRRL